MPAATRKAKKNQDTEERTRGALGVNEFVNVPAEICHREPGTHDQATASHACMSPDSSNWSFPNEPPREQVARTYPNVDSLVTMEFSTAESPPSKSSMQW